VTRAAPTTGGAVAISCRRTGLAKPSGYATIAKASLHSEDVIIKFTSTRESASTLNSKYPRIPGIQRVCEAAPKMDQSEDTEQLRCHSEILTYSLQSCPTAGRIFASPASECSPLPKH